MRQTWEIPVYWEMSGFIQIEADSLEDAIKEFDEKIDDYSLPIEADYLSDSFRRDDDYFCAEYNTIFNKLNEE